MDLFAHDLIIIFLAHTTYGTRAVLFFSRGWVTLHGLRVIRPADRSKTIQAITTGVFCANTLHVNIRIMNGNPLSESGPRDGFTCDPAAAEGVIIIRLQLVKMANAKTCSQPRRYRPIAG